MILIIFCLISVYVGLRIILRYRKYRQRELLLVGLTWIFLVSPWYSGSISFIMFLLLGEILSAELYFIIGTNLWPIALTLWIIAFTDLVYKKHQTLIILISIGYGFFFYVAFYYLLFTDPSLIGYLKGYTDVQYNTFIVVYALSLLIIELVTGYLFCKASLQAEKPEIKLKGKLLLIAFILFAIGGSLDTSVPLTLVTLPLVRSFEILSAIVFYMGFILPKWTKKLFLKKKNDEIQKS